MAKKPWKVNAENKEPKDKLYSPNGWSIKSVTRRSDGLKFTIGDMCKLKYVNVPIRTIKRMWVEEGISWWAEKELKVQFDSGLVMILACKGKEDIIVV